MQEQRIRITFDGRQALTVDLSAAIYGMEHDAMAKLIRRAGIEPLPERIGRIPLFPAAAIEREIRNRPGKGAPGRPRPHRAPAETADPDE